MYNRITELSPISYSENKYLECRHGVYQGKFQGERRIFVITNDIGYVLCHFAERSTLEVLRPDVRDELFALLNLQTLYGGRAIDYKGV